VPTRLDSRLRGNDEAIRTETCRDDSTAGCTGTPRADFKHFPRKRKFLKIKFKISHPHPPYATAQIQKSQIPTQSTHPMPHANRDTPRQ
ncbi:TPA: hypothetical protein ACTCZQ_002174, partial [Neisseria meningitidis]